VRSSIDDVDLVSERPNDTHRVEEPMDIDDDGVVLDLTSPDAADQSAAPPPHFSQEQNVPVPVIIDVDEDMDGSYRPRRSTPQSQTKQITPGSISTSLPPPPSNPRIDHPRLDILKMLQERHSGTWIREVGGTVRRARKFHAKHRSEITQVGSGYGGNMGRSDERVKWKPGLVDIL
jgi:hypothetical protein